MRNTSGANQLTKLTVFEASTKAGQIINSKIFKDMKKVFCINDGHSYIAIAQSISDDENWNKIELRYFSVTDDFQLSEIKFKCIETIKFEKMARKWCDENGLYLWNY